MATLTTVPKPSSDAHTQYYRNKEVDIMARTIWGEARNQRNSGMCAIANVIMNRAKISKKYGGYWWGDDVISVCLKPYQFSCWLRSDPNYQKIETVDETDLHFVTSIRIAKRALAKVLSDKTNGATHYHTKSISPSWKDDDKRTAVIGDHVFYKLV